MEEARGRSGGVVPEMSYLICATPRGGGTLLCDALGRTGIAGRPAEHFEVLLETGRPRQPRDYFQRSNDPEAWALLEGIGIETPEGFTVEAPGMKRQSDELSEEWVNLYSGRKYAPSIGER